MRGGAPLAASAHAASTLSVSATANLHGASHATSPGPDGNDAGVLHVLVMVSESTSAHLTSSNVPGVVPFNRSLTDGLDGTATRLTHMSTHGGLSGYRLSHIRVLSGVFLGGSEPADPAPDMLEYARDCSASEAPAANATGGAPASRSS